MVEVTIDSIRVSLMTQHRVVVLKETDTDRYLPIWIGPFEADAITIQLQGVQVPRPLTHDLLKSFIREMGVKVSHVLVNELRNDTFFARIVMDVNGKSMEIDSRPSDAIALAVRVGAPIFVAEQVMGLVDRGIAEFHFYTLNRADLVYAICYLLGLRPAKAFAGAKAAS